MNGLEHKNKILVIADDAPESELALLFAARRAKHSDTRLSILFMIEPQSFEHWMSVEDAIRAEAYEDAEDHLARYAAWAFEEAGLVAELIIREGRRADQIKAQISEDKDIFLLVLGASDSKEGPGPLVESLAHNPDYLGARPIPVAIVPGRMTREDIRKLS
ncbi:MAG: universal stress protein [Pseudomonadota bacterium]